jgi:hypothetical protein
LKIEDVADSYKMDHDIPDTDSDGVLEMREEWEKRKRSDTMSTVSSDKHGTKRSKVHTMSKYILETCEI